ncbi:hypothetical protein PF008_g21621 [Phytophthora fragariae]|nr:hypothetical protein PR002_g10094 [Phytophthora rubi]KAE9305821.1 hypothetical protein PF008_g21621 [Phytophthora fragariae]
MESEQREAWESASVASLSVATDDDRRGVQVAECPVTGFEYGRPSWGSERTLDPRRKKVNESLTAKVTGREAARRYIASWSQLRVVHRVGVAGEPN